MACDADPDGGQNALTEKDRPAAARNIDQLLPLVYRELRSLAAAHLRSERAGHTLQATALVHEVYLRMAREDRARIQNRSQFLALAAEQMRRILVSHARRRLAAKRGGGWSRITLSEDVAVSDDGAVDLLVLERALEKLAAHDPDAARIVVLRFYGGLTEIEIGEVFDRSERWVREQWSFARVWLRRELGGRDSGLSDAGG